MVRKRIKKVRNDFYVYYLRRPDKTDPFNPELWQPFYVGRGNGGRYKKHRREARGLLKENLKYVNLNTIKNGIIHRLWKKELDFSEEVLVANLTNEEANEIEMLAITTYGRIDLGTGCLSNLTNGGDGFVGYEMTDEHRRSISENHWDSSGENNPNWNNRWSEEILDKMRGPRPSVIGDKNHRYGKHWPIEIKNIIGERQRECQRKKRIEACGHEDWIRCSYCRKYENPKNLDSVDMVQTNKYSGFHRGCRINHKNKLNNCEETND
jgi:hypothetical protein